MPFDLTWFERQIFLRRHWGPGPIIDMFAPLAFRAVESGLKLGLFETLEEKGPISAAQLAQAMNADSYGLEALLTALESLGYVKHDRKLCFVNTRMTRRWILKRGGAEIGEMSSYIEDAFDRWNGLDSAVRKGTPSVNARDWLDRHPERWNRYHGGLRAIARLIAPEIVASVALPSHAKRIIDIGGSHGLYTVAFCRKYPHIEGVIYDVAEARASAQATISAAGMDKRISFVEGDLETDPLGSDFDAVLIFNTIRIFPSPKARALFTKVHESLNVNGVLFVADQFHSAHRRSFAQANSALILLELLCAGAGRPHSAEEVMQMLHTSEFKSPNEHLLKRAPGISVISASKQAA